MNQPDQSASPLSLSEADSRLLRRIADSAQKPLWRHAIEVAFGLFPLAIALALVWVPRYLFPERGIEICQRYGTRWLPIEGALPKLLVPAGTILLFYALLLTMWIVAEILKDRMLHRILSHLLCPTQQAGRSG